MNRSRTEPHVCATKQKMKSRMLSSSLWKIASWKDMFLCGKKSLQNPMVEFPCEVIESEVLPRLRATLELPHEIIESEVLPNATLGLPHEIIESEVLPRLHAMLELPCDIKESEVLPRLHATVELPRDIIEWEILPRLPPKSLGQFMRVCKQWRSLVSTCEFTLKNLYYLKNKQSLTHRKLLKINYLSKTFGTRDCDDLNNHDSTTIHSIPIVNEAQEVLLLASLDGLVFVGLPNTGELAFWNPLTGAYKKLSNSPNVCPSHGAFGFYFDSYKKDYKVLHVTSFGTTFKAFIYSQRLTSKKEIQWLENQQRLSNSLWSTPISLGGSLYFMGRHVSAYHNVTHRHQYWIIVFDVRSEKFREIHFPLLNQENTYNYGGLMVIKGRIHIFISRCMECDGELWRINGDGDDWTQVKDFLLARNLPLTYDEKIDMKDLKKNFKLAYRRKMLYLETLVPPCG